MDPITACQQACTSFQSALEQLDEAQLSAQTPNDEFDVRALAGHAIGGANMFAGMLGGTPAAEMAEGASVAELAATFQAAGQQLAAAAQAEGALAQTVQLGPMEIPGAAAVSLMAADHVVHVWDIAKATGIEANVSEELAQFALDSWQQMLAPQMRDGKQFGAELQAPEGASTLEQVAAFTGRQV